MIMNIMNINHISWISWKTSTSSRKQDKTSIHTPFHAWCCWRNKNVLQKSAPGLRIFGIPGVDRTGSRLQNDVGGTQQKAAAIGHQQPAPPGTVTHQISYCTWLQMKGFNMSLMGYHWYYRQMGDFPAMFDFWKAHLWRQTSRPSYPSSCRRSTRNP